jgi:hypothetical protein
MTVSLAARKWLRKRVRAFYGVDKSTRCRGEVVAYSASPMVAIRVDGDRDSIEWWSVDLCEIEEGE